MVEVVVLKKTCNADENTITKSPNKIPKIKEFFNIEEIKLAKTLPSNKTENFAVTN